MVSTINSETIGLTNTKSDIPASGEIDSFDGTVVAFCSRSMSLKVRKGSGEVVQVALVPSLNISEELCVDMTEMDFLNYRCDQLKAIEGLAKLGIDFPHKIGWLFSKKARIASDGIEVLDDIF